MYAVTPIPLFKRVKIETALDISSAIEEDTLLGVEAVLLVENAIPPLKPIQSDCGSFYSSCGFTGRTLRWSARLQHDKKPVGFYKD